MSELLKQMGLITRKQFCELVSIDESTEKVWRYNRKSPPHSKVGNEIFYAVEDVKRFIASRINHESSESIL